MGWYFTSTPQPQDMEGKKGFSLSNAATASKRCGEQAPSGRKIPKVCETVDGENALVYPLTILQCVSCFSPTG